MKRLGDKKRGWLKIQRRRERRDRPVTFGDVNALSLIGIIDGFDHYISPKWKPEIDNQMRLRDKALISVNWTWFNRGTEVLGLKRKDVYYDDSVISVSFVVKKKKKHFKICPECETRNGKSSNYCRKCRADLREVEISEEGGGKVVTKNKSRQFRFVPYIIEWLEEFDRINPIGEGACLFPPLRVHFQTCQFDFTKPMTLQHYDRILARLDETLTSCHFRYGGVEKYLRLGYTPRDLKVIGNWESSKMPEIYAEKKGLTPEQRRWAKDLR